MAQLITNFVGMATFTIDDPDPRIAGPFFIPINLSPVFSANRRTVDMGVFPPITVGPFGTPLGANTINVTKTTGGSGSFDMGSGHIVVPITLHFDHSLPDLFVGDSDLSLVLTTGAATSPTGAFTLAGTPLNRTTGLVTLVGASKFVGGWLASGPKGARDCSVSIAGTILPSPFMNDRFMPPVYAMGGGPAAIGIGGYNLADPADRAFAFDYDSSGKLDHLVLYRPGTGTIWFLKNTGGTFTAIGPSTGAPGAGIGGYNLADPADRAFAFDYDSSGKLDHLVLYRPGTGTIWFLKNTGGTFTAIGPSTGAPGAGIGGYDLADPADRAFAFDYDGSGKLDHLVLYRPGFGTIWILKNTSGTFTPIYQIGSPGTGIGGYDLADPADRAFAFDYDDSGKLDHLVLYRPGFGTIWILKNTSGTFTPVYQMGSPGTGIGGYDLADPADRAFAFDYDGSGKLDHLALYRPGFGTIWILKNISGTFAPVFSEGSPGTGIGGYDLAEVTDRAFAFDYDGSGSLDHMVLYRAGFGTIWILKRH